ncbi:MAG TPA: caspase family protein [Capsulimonadaceae bacterium]|jgi:WD40 repeat protein
MGYLHSSSLVQSCRSIAVAVLLAISLLPPAAIAASIVETPVLRIENGNHTATINGLVADRSGRYLVTCSDDKTARIWSASSGQLVRTLRPPIGNGIAGQLYAVAITPDGSQVACAGYTESAGSTAKNPSFAVYFYDVQGGELAGSITGLPNAIYGLAYSPAGSTLAITLAAGGVRLYDAHTLRPLAADTAHSAPTYALDVSGSGAIVAGCNDGALSIYNSALKVTATKKLTNQPYCAKFSTDGAHIAVGYADCGKVDIFSSATLKLESTVNTSEATHFSVVCWSSTGALLAGQSATELSTAVIRKWPDFRLDRFTDSAQIGGAITQLAPLSTGGVAYAAIGPMIGAVTPSMTARDIRNMAAADSRLAAGDFLTSPDAKVIVIRGPQSTTRLSISDRAGSVVPTPDAAPLLTGCNPPLTTIGDASIVTHSRGVFQYNGVTTKLPSNQTNRTEEMVNCAAFARDGKSFVLGTDWYLQTCVPTRNGDVQFKTVAPVPAAVRLVNVASNGGVVVAALADGTIRWYRLPDLTELCALFADAATDRWVIWTPGGFYDCSPGGENLIGWHVARSASPLRADFFGASRFRSQFYRPEVIAKALDELDTRVTPSGEKIDAASIISNRKPPVVNILAPDADAVAPDGSARFTYSVHTADGKPATAVKVLVNGRPVEFTEIRLRKIVLQAADSSYHTIEVKTLPPGAKVSIVAGDDNGFSEPASLSMLKPAASVSTPGGGITKSNDIPGQGEIITVPGIEPSRPALRPHGKLYVLAIGVGNYKDTNLTLTYPAKDARDFCDIAMRQKGLRYTDVQIKTVTDEQATADNVEDALDWVKDNATAEDMAMVLISGHGFNDPDGDYRYAPWDFTATNYKHTSVKFSEIRDSLSKVKGQTVLFLDTCHAGNLMESGKARGRLDLTRLINEFTAGECGIAVFAAAQGNQTAEENDTVRNGVFTKAIVEGIDGKADPYRLGQIQVLALGNYISYAVNNLTHGRQNPTVTLPSTITNFDVAYVK